MKYTDLKNSLKRRYVIAIAALLIALLAVSATTYAWYIYQTGNKTTELHMAAGTSDSILISANGNDFGYAKDVIIDNGALQPVSTSKIKDGEGFKTVTMFDYGNGETDIPLAKVFTKTKDLAFLKSKVYLRTEGTQDFDIYVEEISFDKDSEDANNPLSTAVRVGLVTSSGEKIFEINEEHNPSAQYNTYNVPEPGKMYALDGDANDNTVIEFYPLNSRNYYNPQEDIGSNSNAVSIGTLHAGTDMPVDLYLWLEGCDEDCTSNLSGKSVSNLSIKFYGVPRE